MTYKATKVVNRMGSSWRKDIVELPLPKVLKKFPKGAIPGSGGVYSRRECAFVNESTGDTFRVYSRSKQTRIGATWDVSEEAIEQFALWLATQLT